eukprot:TRINITY_DN54784_c0_g1_i1.p1 TRINITY_DN54784_c0_g1~~TRINITY_DN54784_c0_g1_i1.p1  ORF type:complete len:216 (+),score=8.92 TRINITY_DN54784_c0_g1_i1:31-678(+)
MTCCASYRKYILAEFGANPPPEDTHNSPRVPRVYARPFYRGRDPQGPYKLVLLGDPNVGKSCLHSRILGNGFPAQSATIVTSYGCYQTKVGSMKVQLRIWDTAGQERFHALPPIYYRDADGVMVVYDVTCMSSFQGVQRWVEEVRHYLGTGAKIPIYVVGNKTDLANKQVRDKDAQQLCDSIGAAHFLVSAKYDLGVTAMFDDMASSMPHSSQFC